MIDLDFVRGLIRAMDESGLDSLELVRSGTRIRLSKTPLGASGAAAPVLAVAQPVAPVPPLSPSPAPVGAALVAPAAESTPDAVVAAAPNLVDVKSPMVGTFYRAPAPEAPSYVEVGSRVSRGQTLCILEAMKLMNELEAEVDGIIREIPVGNGDPVEYGQVLFRVEPA